MHLAVQDRQFMLDSLKGVEDDFIQNLLDIYELVTADGNCLAPEMAIVRADYMFMVDQKAGIFNPKHIETNVMGVAFVGSGTKKMKELHFRTLSEAKLPELVNHLPENKAVHMVAKTMVKAWKLYGNPSADIVFLLLDNDNNPFDCFQIAYEIDRLNTDVQVRTLHLNSLPGRTHLKEDGKLIIDKREVGLLYYITGYHPDHYATEEVWKIRRDLELSRAVKCSSVGQQLFECKKMQEVLARPGVLERFLNKEAANRMRQTFLHLYSLEMNEEGDKVVKMALEDPHKFVLKPQREGKGSNLYGDKISELLKEIGSVSKRTGFILMELVKPSPTLNYLIRNRQVTKAEIVSELGIYGVCIVSNGSLVENCTVGNLIRSKPKDKVDGSVLAGVAALDSVLLV